MCSYKKNDLIFIKQLRNCDSNRSKSNITIGKVLQTRFWKNQWYISICDAYNIEKQYIVTVNSNDNRVIILGKVPLYAQPMVPFKKHYIGQICGYAKRIACESMNIQSSEKKHNIIKGLNLFTTKSKHLKYKNVEFKNGFHSSINLSNFDDKTYEQLFNCLTFNAKHILMLGSGDLRLILEIFLDFNQFPDLHSLFVIEVDCKKFSEIEAIFDNCVRILKLNTNFENSGFDSNCNRSSFKVEKFYEKRISDYSIMPIKMCLSHRYSKRKLIFHRQIFWDILPKISKCVQFQVICNWLTFTSDSIRKLFSAKYLLRKRRQRNILRIMISVQTIPKKLQRLLSLHEIRSICLHDGCKSMVITSYAK